MKRIAVLTSGGDAPGMNAAVRSVVRTGIDRGWEVFGVRHGYEGLTLDDFVSWGSVTLAGLSNAEARYSGVRASRSSRLTKCRKPRFGFFANTEISALVVVGGDGSQAGAYALSRKGFPVVGIASTIDNDLYGSDITIGVDTALNVALEAIDRIKVTASTQKRAFLVEVMGRNCGYLALISGIAGGAESIVLPEVETDPETIASELRDAYERGKAHAIVVVAERGAQRCRKG